MNNDAEGCGCGVIILLVIGAAIVFIVGCIGTPVTDETEMLKNVTALYYHEPRVYSFATQEGNTVKIKQVRSDEDPEFVLDVPEGELMYVEHRAVGKKGYYMKDSYKFHIHSMKEVTGAGWNHGKKGSGTTTKLEEEQ